VEDLREERARRSERWRVVRRVREKPVGRRGERDEMERGRCRAHQSQSQKAIDAIVRLDHLRDLSR
jgi:hypothetical protein